MRWITYQKKFFRKNEWKAFKFGFEVEWLKMEVQKIMALSFSLFETLERDEVCRWKRWCEGLNSTEREWFIESWAEKTRCMCCGGTGGGTVHEQWQQFFLKKYIYTYSKNNNNKIDANNNNHSNTHLINKDCKVLTAIRFQCVETV